MDNDSLVGLISTILVSIVTIVLLGFLFWFFPMYGVWQSKIHIMQAQNEGMARLAEANQSRQIKIAEAKALKESAVYYAEAEVERAKGAAKANKIIGNSLKGHEEYLMYLYIQNMHQTKNQIIYIPTEGGLPVLEASRLKSK